jgi:hypothetical protein
VVPSRWVVGNGDICRYRGERDASPNGLSFIHTVRAAQRSAAQRSAVQYSEGRRCVRAAYPPYLMVEYPSYLPVQYSRDEGAGSAERGGS